MAMVKQLEKLDHALFRLVFFRARNPVFDVVMPVLSTVGNRGFLWLAASLALSVFGGNRGREVALATLAAIAAAGLISECMIKTIVKRRRPAKVIEDAAPRVPGRRYREKPSFPSGHAASYFAGAFAWCAFYPQYAALILTLAALGAFSRVYNGVHFPFDALVGSLIGIAVGVLMF